MDKELTDKHWKIIIATTVGAAFAVASAIIVLTVLICRQKIKDAKRRKEQLNQRLNRRRWLNEQSNHPIREFIQNNNQNNIINNNYSQISRTFQQQSRMNPIPSTNIHCRSRVDNSFREIDPTLPLPREDSDILQGPINLNYKLLQQEKYKARQRTSANIPTKIDFGDHSLMPNISKNNFFNNQAIASTSNIDDNNNPNRFDHLSSSSLTSFSRKTLSLNKRYSGKNNRNAPEFELSETTNVSDVNSSTFNTIDSEIPCLHRHHDVDLPSSDNCTCCSGDDSGYSPMELAEIGRNFKSSLTRKNIENIKMDDPIWLQRRYRDLPSSAFPLDRTARESYHSNNNCYKQSYDKINSDVLHVVS